MPIAALLVMLTGHSAAALSAPPLDSTALASNVFQLDGFLTKDEAKAMHRRDVGSSTVWSAVDGLRPTKASRGRLSSHTRTSAVR